nr:uncharacterized protein LOC111429254 [Onthophagus taurus]XP_022920903.1 uncharacterized protein LOC111429254 [Onthophagus taurus]
MLEEFFSSFIIPTKIIMLLSLTASATEFALKKDLISFLMAMINFVTLYLCHASGQRITSTASSVAETVYDLNWYDADISTRKYVLLLLCMTQKLFMTEVPLFGEISHAAVAKEYKMVYVFCNWILKVTK